MVNYYGLVDSLLSIMDVRHFEVFLYAARLCNVRLAARELQVSESRIRDSLLALERTFGAHLAVHRETGNIALTPEGERILVYATQIVALQRQAKVPGAT